LLLSAFFFLNDPLNASGFCLFGGSKSKCSVERDCLIEHFSDEIVSPNHQTGNADLSFHEPEHLVVLGVLTAGFLPEVDLS
jgi:hypothetical protein